MNNETNATALEVFFKILTSCWQVGFHYFIGDVEGLYGEIFHFLMIILISMS